MALNTIVSVVKTCLLIGLWSIPQFISIGFHYIYCFGVYDANAIIVDYKYFGPILAINFVICF